MNQPRDADVFGARRRSFGVDAATYDAVRPEWPTKTVACGSGVRALRDRAVQLGMRQSVEDLVLHASTWSYVAIHPERDRVLDEVRAMGRRVADATGWSRSR